MTNPYQPDRTQAEHEARAKILWGDPPEEVIHFLRVQSIGLEEATEMVEAMCAERRATIRGMGVKKIIIGSLMVAVPLATYLIFKGYIAEMASLLSRIGAVVVAIGLWGLWILINGLCMFLSPQSKTGDVSDE